MIYHAKYNEDCETACGEKGPWVLDRYFDTLEDEEMCPACAANLKKRRGSKQD